MSFPEQKKQYDQEIEQKIKVYGESKISIFLHKHPVLSFINVVVICSIGTLFMVTILVLIFNH
jgi:hypothetical protein